MKKISYSLALLAQVVALSAYAAPQWKPLDETRQEPPQVHSYHWTRNAAASHQLRNIVASSPNLLYHSGVVMGNVTIQPIFWGSGWNGGNQDIVNGISNFYYNYSSAPYSQLVKQYTDINGDVPGTTVNVENAIVDTSTSSTNVFNRVCAAVAQNTNLISAASKKSLYVPVYVDSARGNANYCGYHSAGTCGLVSGNKVTTVAVEFGFFFSLVNDAGCHTQLAPGETDQTLANLVNVTAHELSELLTDPATFNSNPPSVYNAYFGGWFDASGNEIGDKCAWKFSSSPQNIGGQNYFLQSEWSNLITGCANTQ